MKRWLLVLVAVGLAACDDERIVQPVPPTDSNYVELAPCPTPDGSPCL